jgi:NTE family protein
MYEKEMGWHMLDGGRALVLGGGGVTGIAWEIGLLLGLAERGVELSTADGFVGTSAGSVVAAQLTSGVPLDRLFAEQEAGDAPELRGRLGVGGILRFTVAGAWRGDPARGRAWLGRAALKARTVPEAERLAVIERRLPARTWPARPLLLTAVDAETGATVVFDSTSGVSLLDAVAASCAVPTVWAPVTIAGRRYIDGGARSVANADLAAGCARLVVITPRAAAVRRADRPDAQAAALGVPFAVASPDRAARAAMGRDSMDPARRAASARAGREQAARLADHIRPAWD